MKNNNQAPTALQEQPDSLWPHEGDEAEESSEPDLLHKTAGGGGGH